MKIESPLPVYIAYEVEYLDDQGLIDWEAECLPTSEYFGEDFDLIELVSISTKNVGEVEKAGSYLSSLIYRQWPGFNLKGNEAKL